VAGRMAGRGPYEPRLDFPQNPNILATVFSVPGGLPAPAHARCWINRGPYREACLRRGESSWKVKRGRAGVGRVFTPCFFCGQATGVPVEPGGLVAIHEWSPRTLSKSARP